MGFDFNDICFDDEIEGKKLDILKRNSSYILDKDMIADIIKVLQDNKKPPIIIKGKKYYTLTDMTGTRLVEVD